MDRMVGEKTSDEEVNDPGNDQGNVALQAELSHHAHLAHEKRVETDYERPDEDGKDCADVDVSNQGAFADGNPVDRKAHGGKQSIKHTKYHGRISPFFWIAIGLRERPTVPNQREKHQTAHDKRDQYRSEERRVGKECRSRWSPY